MKSLVTVGAIAHKYFESEIARNSKAFCVPENRRNLIYNQKLPLIIS